MGKSAWSIWRKVKWSLTLERSSYRWHCLASTLWTCHGQNILRIVEGRWSHCWSCGAMGNLSKACPSQNLVTPTQQSTTSKEAVGLDKSGQAPNDLNESQQVAKKGQKTVTPPQQDAPQCWKQNQQQQLNQGMKKQQPQQQLECNMEVEDMPPLHSSWKGWGGRWEKCQKRRKDLASAGRRGTWNLPLLRKRRHLCRQNQEHRNAREFPGVIKNVGRKLKVWDLLDAAQKSFPNTKMAHVESGDLKKLAKLCAESVLVLLHLSL